MNSKVIWNNLRSTIVERFDTEYPPFRNVVILFQGDNEDSVLDVIQVESEFDDGVLQLLIGPETITASLTWTYQRRFFVGDTTGDSEAS